MAKFWVHLYNFKISELSENHQEFWFTLFRHNKNMIYLMVLKICWLHGRYIPLPSIILAITNYNNTENVLNNAETKNALSDKLLLYNAKYID